MFAASPSTSAAAVPKVVFIVGPAGAATNGYRAQARAAAASRSALHARTWSSSTRRTRPGRPSSRRSQGASLVVYMGHGNGWPSKYRDALYPPTQNGFGLNPAAGGGDSTHQYFGEGVAVAGQAGQERRRPAQPPVLRERHFGARPAGRHARRRPASASTTTPPGSSRPAPRRSSPRRGQSPSYFVTADPRWRPVDPGAPGRAAPARTAIGSPSRARAARATSPRWTPRPRRPGSPARSS